MNSGASWNERGLSPELYQAAREAARRAGMSVDEWLTSTFGNSSAAGVRPAQGSFGHRLEAEPAQTSVRGARLSDTVAKLNARLEQLTSGRPAPAETRPPRTEERAPSIAPEPFDLGIDQAIAEIAARQRALDEAPQAPAPQAAAYAAAPQPTQPAEVHPDFSSLERQLHNIAAQIETLRRPSGVEDMVAALRGDLAEVARVDPRGAAAPRTRNAAERDARARRADRARLWPRRRSVRAGEHRAPPQRGAQLAQRDDAGRGPDRLRRAHRRALAQDGQPAGRQLDRSRRCCATSKPPSTSCASSPPASRRPKASPRSRATCRRSSARIDHIADRTGSTGLDSLAARVGELTHALDTRVEQIGPMPSNLEALVQSLTDKLNGSDKSAREQAAFAQLERQISGHRREARSRRSAQRRSQRDRARHPATDPAGARGARGSHRHRGACRPRRSWPTCAAERRHGSHRAQARYRVAARQSVRERAAHARDARSRARHAGAPGRTACHGRDRRPRRAAGELRAAVGLCAASRAARTASCR